MLKPPPYFLESRILNPQSRKVPRILTHTHTHTHKKKTVQFNLKEWFNYVNTHCKHITRLRVSSISPLSLYFECMCYSPLLWWRAKAQNVSFVISSWWKFHPYHLVWYQIWIMCTEGICWQIDVGVDISTEYRLMYWQTVCRHIHREYQLIFGPQMP